MSSGTNIFQWSIQKTRAGFWLGTFSVIPRKKVLIPVYSEGQWRVNSEAQNGTELREKISFIKQPKKLFKTKVAWSNKQNWDHVFLPRNSSEQNSESFILFLFYGTEFQVVFSFAEWFGTEFREFSVPRNSQNSVGTNNLFRLFRLPRNYFWRKFPTILHNDN